MGGRLLLALWEGERERRERLREIIEGTGRDREVPRPGDYDLATWPRQIVQTYASVPVRAAAPAPLPGHRCCALRS